MGPRHGFAEYTGSPTLSPDEKTLYLFKRVGGGLMAFDSLTGKVLWHDKTKYYSDYSSPVVGPDGVIYVPDRFTEALYAIEADGTPRWKAVFKGRKLHNSIATIGRDGTVYISVQNKQSLGGTFYALKGEDGSIKWSYDFEGGYMASPPAIDRDGNIYVASGNGYVFCFDEKGGVLWSLLVGSEKLGADQIFMSGPVLSDGVLYIVTGSMKKWARLVAVGSK
jgi:outer membrane protein assembly factor BamB